MQLQSRTLEPAPRIDLTDITGHFLPNEPRKRRQKDLRSTNNELKNEDEEDGNDRRAIRNRLTEESTGMSPRGGSRMTAGATLLRRLAYRVGALQP